jgi:hypothetical protein
MGDPTATNKIATEVDGAIKNANSAGVTFVESLIIADYPPLAFPPLKLILGWVLGFLDGYISKAEQAGVSFKIYQAQAGAELTQLQKAEADLVQAEQHQNPADAQKAIQEVADAQSALVHSDGSATPQ